MTLNTGLFQATALARDYVLQNVQDELRKDVMDNPKLFLALIIHNGGHHMRTHIPNHAFKFEAAIAGLHLPGKVVCHKTEAQSPAVRKGGTPDKYAPPFVVLAEVDNAETRDYLLKQGVLAWTPLLSCGGNATGEGSPIMGRRSLRHNLHPRQRPGSQD